jgi:hypothetical protein
MPTSEQEVAEIRANIAAAEQREKDRIQRIVDKASKQTEAWAAERDAAERKAEQEREAAWKAREQAKVEAAREAFRSAYLVAGGDESLFDEAYRRHRLAEAERQIAAQQHAARESMRRSF